ncbi:hypothetical protein [Candidatus Korobacter versatilis]|uniref:hypothetical protein n=1 Tax=Candidatus Korobacter versatilis TaxID=658062 RepID=UPI0005A4B12C|nr:hypothetical protein [Candidatus Koribacter versatilis]
MKIVLKYLAGTVLCLILIIWANAILDSHYEMPRLFAEARQTNNAVPLISAMAAAHKWIEYVIAPLTGCVIGLYAALVQKRHANILAIAILLPFSLYALATESLRSLGIESVLGFLGANLVQFVLAAFVASALRRVLDSRNGDVFRSQQA